MKTIILAVAAAMAIAGTAAAQTSDPGATTSLPSSMAPTNSPTPANKINTDGTSGRTTKSPSANATGAVSPIPSGFPAATDDNPPPNCDPNSPGRKSGSGKAGGGSK